MVAVEVGDALADPAHDGDGHAVAEGLVAGAIGGGLATPWDERVIVREALEAFALPRGEATDLHGGSHDLERDCWHSATTRFLHPKRWR